MNYSSSSTTGLGFLPVFTGASCLAVVVVSTSSVVSSTTSSALTLAFFLIVVLSTQASYSSCVHLISVPSVMALLTGSVSLNIPILSATTFTPCEGSLNEVRGFFNLT